MEQSFVKHIKATKEDIKEGCSTISILGVDYYDSMIDNHLIISDDLSEKIEPIIKLMKRKDIIDSISKKEKNE